jgi:hypothetical protein
VKVAPVALKGATGLWLLPIILKINCEASWRVFSSFLFPLILPLVSNLNLVRQSFKLRFPLFNRENKTMHDWAALTLLAYFSF